MGSSIEPVAWIVSLFLAVLFCVLGVKMDPGGAGAKFKTWLFNSVYRKKLKESRLYELMGEESEGSPLK